VPFGLPAANDLNSYAVADGYGPTFSSGWAGTPMCALDPLLVDEIWPAALVREFRWFRCFAGRPMPATTILGGQ